ncbi:MAG: hypothetical protein LQ350_004298 [Teloschistes chrysophthalmus]|nr:MAG: hypothetical protein LQ350_004298 [Niorma chrysophthalma]
MPLILDSSPSPSPPPSPIESSPATLRRRDHNEADVVIVGAGILGTSLAVTLARQGRSVILLEKSLKEPDRIVGELLQPGGVQALKELGLRECLDDIDAIRVKGYEVIYYGTEVHIPYPANAAGDHDRRRRRGSGGAFDGENPGVGAMEEKKTLLRRPEGRSFHHGRFIQQLRLAAMREENISLIERTVTGTVKNDWTGQVVGVEAENPKNNGSGDAARDVYFGQLTVLADGYASRFRKEFIAHAPVSKSKFYGLELIDAVLPREMHGHVILGDGAPVLLYQIGTRETRALVDVRDGTPTASVANGGVKGHLRNVVLPSLPECVQPSFERALDEGKLRSMPNSWLPPSTQQVPGMVLLGDAMNMRHPLTGGGMTVAFNDVLTLRDLLSPENIPDLGDTAAVKRQMRRFHWQRKNLTSVINILAQALYSLFAAEGNSSSFPPPCTPLTILITRTTSDPQLKILQRGCFRYFQRGGSCIDGPVGLLAGIIRQPFVLFYHFFAVALLAIWLTLCGSPVWRLPLTLVESAGVFWKACVVIFPFIFSEMRW